MQDMTADLRFLSLKLEQAGKAGKEEQRAVHEELAGAMLSSVRGIIGGCIYDTHGKIQGYQDKHVGSKGGYAAVRPNKKPGGPNGAGAVTNYLENGHAIRRPGGSAKRYKPRIRTLYVAGNGFYAAARGHLGNMQQRIALRIANAVTDTIEGG